MDRKARIIAFRSVSDSPADELEKIIREQDEMLDEWPPLLFSDLDADDLVDDELVFIDSSFYLVDGSEGVTVAVSAEPMAMSTLLENGKCPYPGCQLPMLRDVEILLSGDTGSLRFASELPSFGIFLDGSGNLALDESWKLTGYGFTPHFRTEIWKCKDRPLTLETTLRAEPCEGSHE